MARQHTHDAVIKISTPIFSAAAAWITHQGVKRAWKQVTGNDAPTDLDDPDFSLASAVAFAAVSAGVGVVVQRFAVHHGRRLVSKALHCRTRSA